MARAAGTWRAHTPCKSCMLKEKNQLFMLSGGSEVQRVLHPPQSLWGTGSPWAPTHSTGLQQRPQGSWRGSLRASGGWGERGGTCRPGRWGGAAGRPTGGPGQSGPRVGLRQPRRGSAPAPRWAGGKGGLSRVQDRPEGAVPSERTASTNHRPRGQAMSDAERVVP